MDRYRARFSENRVDIVGDLFVGMSEVGISAEMMLDGSAILT